ncbi:MAG TPA: hypothetical protein VF221_19175 [Chloroflexota bacterium]
MMTATGQHSQQKQSRWHRTLRQVAVFAVNYTAAYVVAYVIASHLNGRPVDTRTTLVLAAAIFVETVVVALTLPWTVAAIKWVFQ